jgi:hypothetical protein
LEKRGGNTEGAPKKYFGTIPYFLFYHRLRESFSVCSVEIVSFQSVFRQQAQQIENTFESVLAIQNTFESVLLRQNTFEIYLLGLFTITSVPYVPYYCYAQIIVST